MANRPCCDVCCKAPLFFQPFDFLVESCVQAIDYLLLRVGHGIVFFRRAVGSERLLLPWRENKGKKKQRPNSSR